MLSDLVVEGLGVIDRAELSLEPGSTALTGETGAGKTMVVAALGLLLGGRADRSLIRSGAAEARVEGRFVLPAGHPALDLLVSGGWLDEPSGEDTEVVMTRSIAATGKGGKARINGRLATVGALSDAGRLLVEIAGQHEHQRLTSAAHQRRLLDGYAGEETAGLARAVAEAVAGAVAARRRADELLAGERERRREADVLEFEIAEISSSGLDAGEEERLLAEARRLSAAEELSRGLGAAAEALGGEGGATESLTAARDLLASLAPSDPVLGELAGRLGDALLEIEDVAAEAARRPLEPDPGALEMTRSRLDVIGRLKRKYGADVGEVLAYLARARARLDEITGEDSDLERISDEAAVLYERALALAGELSERRKEAAVRLAQAAEAMLGDLALAGARVEVALEDRDLYEGGLESVEIRIAANPGEEPKPVARVASGGELSRIALALYLLTSSGSADTMVFDEVDAGVGGEAAQQVGRALKELAGTSAGQVVVVTHLPQVAAYADRHLLVTKDTVDGRAVSEVAVVEDAARVAELSRMLSGLPDSAGAQRHAEELLDYASGRAAG